MWDFSPSFLHNSQIKVYILLSQMFVSLRRMYNELYFSFLDCLGHSFCVQFLIAYDGCVLLFVRALRLILHWLIPTSVRKQESSHEAVTRGLSSCSLRHLVPPKSLPVLYSHTHSAWVSMPMPQCLVISRFVLLDLTIYLCCSLHYPPGVYGNVILFKYHLRLLTSQISCLWMLKPL